VLWRWDRRRFRSHASYCRSDSKKETRWGWPRVHVDARWREAREARDEEGQQPATTPSTPTTRLMALTPSGVGAARVCRTRQRQQALSQQARNTRHITYMETAAASRHHGPAEGFLARALVREA
jgi:hypothetical protein